MNPLDLARDRLLGQTAAFDREVGDADSGYLRSLREEGRSHFASLGFPTTRLEEWRYTNVGPIAATDFRLAEREHPPIPRTVVEEIAFPVFACSLFVFANGHFRPELSSSPILPGELRVESLAQLRSEDPEALEPHLGRYTDQKSHSFAALNTALLDDGAVVTIPRGARLENPVHLVFISNGETPTLSQPRVLVVAEEHSRAVVIQDHVSVGDGVRFTNSVSEVVTHAEADLDLVILQRESDRTHHVSNLSSRQQRNSRFRAHTVTLDGSLVRNDLGALLAEEGAECVLNGVFLGRGSQLIDNHTVVDHAVPHGTSRELYKGILCGKSKGVFRGRVIVRPDAQKTDAEQSNPNLLVADGAEINTKPQLEIYADDVKCSHGSAIGRLDADALFYLRSRGIDEERARLVLTRGFAVEVLEQLPAPALRDATLALLEERLRDAGVGS
jgi:Fe-S cluster assembly protein SufD